MNLLTWHSTPMAEWTMVDDGFVLWESNAIVRYLCAKHGMGTWCPAELQRRMDMERWMDWQHNVKAWFDRLCERPAFRRNVYEVE